MRVYVATKFENVAEVHELMQEIEPLGFNLAYDWTKSGPPTFMEAVKDMEAVKHCDLLIGLFTKELQYKGAIAEVGMAIAWEKPILIVGNQLDSMVFTKLPHFTKFSNLRELVFYLKILAK